jgi:hypothetical protein
MIPATSEGYEGDTRGGQLTSHDDPDAANSVRRGPTAARELQRGIGGAQVLSHTSNYHQRVRDELVMPHSRLPHIGWSRQQRSMVAAVDLLLSPASLIHGCWVPGAQQRGKGAGQRGCECLGLIAQWSGI